MFPVAARESLLFSNEHRRAPVDEKALVRIRNAFDAIGDPDLAFSNASDPQDAQARAALRDSLTRIAFEQFPYATSSRQNTSRAFAIFSSDALALPRLKTLTTETADQLFGAPIGQVLGATFMIQAFAAHNRGLVNEAWLGDDARLADVFAVWPRKVFQLRLEALTVTQEGFKAAGTRHDKSYRKSDGPFKDV